jgi:hypothetical protein
MQLFTRGGLLIAGLRVNPLNLNRTAEKGDGLRREVIKTQTNTD